MDDLIDDIAFLIDDEGRNMTLRKKAAGAYSPSTSSATVTTTDYPVKGFVLDYKDHLRDGTIIQAGDRKAVIKAKSLVTRPLANDFIVIDNREFAIVEPRTIEQKGESIVYICQIRG